MRHCRVVAVIFLLMLAVTGPISAQPAPKDWRAMVRSSRDGLFMVQSAANALERAMFGPWYAIGPFRSTAKAQFTDVFPPEREIVLDRQYDSLRWTKHEDWKSGRIVSLVPAANCATYLYRTITAHQDTALTFFLGSDDGLKVWLNGVLQCSDDASRGAEPNQDTVRAALKAGENHLLMKITNGDGPHAFYFSLVGGNREGLWASVRSQIHEITALREMAWEESDGIWAEDWTPGDLQALGDRYYKAACRLSAEEEAGAVTAPQAVKSAEQLNTIADLYCSLHRRELDEIVSQMPKESPAPRINGPRVFGVRPGHPFLFAIPATGERPMTFSVEGLPHGLSVDARTGQITGRVKERGEYKAMVTAKNAKGSASREFRIVVGDRIALTPPLGWNSWNCFAGAVTDAKVRAAADAMVSSGLINHGWSYINIDDCWMVQPDSKNPMLGGEPRDARGRIRANGKFPDMAALADYLHGKGMKLGIYSSPGPLTCAGYAGTYQHEPEDARQYADWTIDYLKYDWCSYGDVNRDTTRAGYLAPYGRMRNALDAVDRDIVFSLCQYGMRNVWEWGDSVGGNCWRTTGDITDTWKSMTGIGFNQSSIGKYAGPGHWNDPDMLVVGWVGWGENVRPSALTPNEQITHITLWSLLCSPLLIGCDMTKLDDFTYGLLSNDEVLDVNQDPLGRQAARVVQHGTSEVWCKEMEDGSRAVGLFNRGDKKADITVTWQDLGLLGECSVRDLWHQRNLGVHDSSFTVTVPRHGAILLNVAAKR